MNLRYYTDLIINNLEGGYYHPDMKANLRGGERMGNSGETMFGLDRVHGGSLNTSENGVKFWQIVDNNYGSHHAETKYYGDKADGKLVPASVGESLKDYLTEIMSAQLAKNAAKLSDGAREIVFNNPDLLMQFFYACWNGSGNFQTFANVVNAAYDNGEKKSEAWWNLIQTARRNKGGLFAEGADKLDGLRSQLSSGASSGWGWGLALLAVLGIGVLVSRKKKKRKK